MQVDLGTIYTAIGIFSAWTALVIWVANLARDVRDLKKWKETHEREHRGPRKSERDIDSDEVVEKVNRAIEGGHIKLRYPPGQKGSA